MTPPPVAAAVAAPAHATEDLPQQLSVIEHAFGSVAHAARRHTQEIDTTTARLDAAECRVRELLERGKTPETVDALWSVAVQVLDLAVLARSRAQDAGSDIRKFTAVADQGRTDVARLKGDMQRLVQQLTIETIQQTLYDPCFGAVDADGAPCHLLNPQFSTAPPPPSNTR